MFNILVFQFIILHVALQGINFGNGIADGSPCHEVHTAPVVLTLQITTLDEQIECLGGSGNIAEAGDIHGSLEGEILELVAFVDKQGIHAQIREIHGPVFLPSSGKQGIVAFLHFLALFLKLLDGGPSAFSGFGSLNGLDDRVNLFPENLLLHVAGHVDFFEGTVCHNNGIPIAGGDTSKQPFPVLFGEVRLVGYQNVRIGIEFIEFIFPLI